MVPELLFSHLILTSDLWYAIQHPSWAHRGLCAWTQEYVPPGYSMESAIYRFWPALASSHYGRVTVVPHIPLPCSVPSSVTSFSASTATPAGKVPVPICLHPVSLVTKYCSRGLSVPHQGFMCSNSLIFCSGFIVAALCLGAEQESTFLTHWPLFSDQVPWSRFSLPSEWLFLRGFK